MPAQYTRRTTATEKVTDTAAAAGCPRDAGGAYRRARDLPRLIALWPRELADASLAGRARILARLRQALRAERRRGSAGHWTYDVARHAQLVAAYRAELTEYERELGAAKTGRPA